MKKYLEELYKRKDLLIYLVTSGLKAQHRNNILGYFWWLLDPLLGILTYYFVVVIVFKRGGEGYGPYLVTGMILWRWVSTAINTASRSIFAQGGIIQQVYLPKAIFPLSASITQLINFVFGLGVIAIFFIFFKIHLGLQILWLPYLVLTMLLFLTAISLAIALSSAFIRDIDYLSNHLLRLWFYASPVIWEESSFPSRINWLLNLNPMTHFLTGFRSILISNLQPDLLALTIIGSLSLIAVMFILYVYNKYEHNIIKNL